VDNSQGFFPSDNKPTENFKEIQDELTHVNHEMYKKNLELSEKNKILSLIRKVDGIILSTVTDPKLIAQKVTNIITEEANFIKMMTIFLLDKSSGSLNQLAISQTQAERKSELELHLNLQELRIHLKDEKNIIVKAVTAKKMLLTHDLYEVFTPYMSREQANQLVKYFETDTSYVYPLTIRTDVIGAMVISVEELKKPLPYYKIDLIDRIPGTIAIAIGNALLYQNIQKANEHLKQLDRLKTEFVSIASHELRTPMTVIKSYVWMLLNGKSGPVSDKQKTYLERTFSSIERLLDLVNNMLNISRIEAGRLVVSPVLVDIREIVSNVITDMNRRAEDVGVELYFYPPSTPLLVKADSGRLKEVLINLIGNSLKFTPRDGSITVSVHKNEDGIVTRIKDTGCGIKSEDIPKLFQKFNMVGSTNLTKEISQGTGLGLYLSKSLVELHGGRIWVESEGENRGSTFSFVLPAVESAALQTYQSSEDPIVEPTPSQEINTQLSPLPNHQA